MGGRDPDPDGKLAEFEATDPMDARGAKDREPGGDLGKDSRSLLFREGGVGLVLKSVYRLTLVVIADAALELDVGAGAHVEQLGGEGDGIEWRGGNPK